MTNGLERQWIAFGGTLIELVAAIAISFHALWAVLALVRREGIDRARLLIADGVFAGLGFSVTGTLLTTIALQSWRQMGFFVFVFALRTMLKRVFAWERKSH